MPYLETGTLTKFIAPRDSAKRALASHRHVISPALQLLLGHRSTPELIEGTRLHVWQHESTRGVHDEEPQLVEPVRLHGRVQVRDDDSWMQGHRLDARVATRQLLREQDVVELREPVTAPGVVLFQLRRFGDEDPRGGAIVARGRDVDDPHIRVGLRRRLLQRWEQQPGQQEVAHVVGAELDLVAFLGGSHRGGHDAGVVDQDVQPLGLLQELLGAFLDRVERGEVQRDVGYRRVWDGLLDLADGGFGL